jgi:hypothetical protein
MPARVQGVAAMANRSAGVKKVVTTVGVCTCGVRVSRNCTDVVRRTQALSVVTSSGLDWRLWLSARLFH